MRTSRTSDTKSYSYVYSGDTLVQMTITDHTTSPETVQLLEFAYDAAGQPLMLTLDGTRYYYVLNIQGDVTGLTDEAGNIQILYYYEGYGEGHYLSDTSDMTSTLVAANPLAYRGYVMDIGTAQYYLQSRYFDPARGRFLNADAYASTGQGLLGNNMFSYCLNNPANGCDPCGTCYHSEVFWKDCTKCKREKAEVDKIDLEFILSNLAADDKDGKTCSVGVVAGTSYGGVGGGGSACVSVDTSYNYALQRTESLNAGGGMGASAGLVFTYTNADNVQDLQGVSSAVGFTVCGIAGISIDLISFTAATNPNKKMLGSFSGVIIGC